MTEWPLELLPWLLTVVAGVVYWTAWHIVNAAHPANRMPVWRLVMWLGGLVVILAALTPPLDGLADDLLTAHMAQHLLLSMVAPPLLAAGAPVLLALRTSNPQFRSRVLLQVLHSRPVRAAASPLLAWLLFTVVMWGTHFTPIYEAALENEGIHVAEHMAFLVAGCLFWWPVVGADPMPRRLRYAPRLAYLVAQMPVNAAVGLAIYFAPSVLYPHYVTTAPLRGIDAVADQQIGGLVMWAAGDLLLLGSVAALVAVWMRADARRTERQHAEGSAPQAG
jgi:putative copper resistance protein D